MADYKYMMNAEDVARKLNCSKSHAYKLVKRMNTELAQQGYLTIAGKIPRAYWAGVECYGGSGIGQRSGRGADPGDKAGVYFGRDKSEYQ